MVTDRILTMDFSKSILFFCKARDKEENDKLFFRWCTGGYQSEISFDDFKMKAYEASRQPKEKSVKEILKKVKKIIDNKE